MTFGELIQTNNWPTIREYFTDLYEEDESLEGYEDVFNQLLIKAPTESNLLICIVKRTDDAGDEQGTFYDVSGLDCESLHLPAPTYYALDFTPWSEWLAMEVEQETLQQFSEAEIICHCLYEMTYVSFDEAEIRAKWDELQAQVSSLKDLTDEEKQTNIISWERTQEKKNIDINIDINNALFSKN